MRLVIQRTSGAELYINGNLFSKSDKGLLVLFGTKAGDSEASIQKLADKTVHLRIFEDENGKMNRSCLDIQGEIMVVSQFTLYANTDKGRRPSFNSAMEPTQAEALYEKYIAALKEYNLPVATGQFGASMDIRFSNDGPVTIIIDHDV